MLDIGSRFEDRELQVYGLMLQGIGLVSQAKVEQGMSMIDEATVAAVGDELTPYATGAVYCMTMYAVITSEPSR
jgi:hypothetical protein